MLPKLAKKLFRAPILRQFCSVDVTVAAQNEAKPPVWTKPYDAAKYEVINTKIKTRSGYAFMDLEPMPRAKLLKIGYIILDKLKAIDENVLFRIYQEEKTKWIMEKADEIEDVEELEAALGTDSIERFILFWRREVTLVDQMIIDKPWNMKPTEEEQQDMREFEKETEETLRHQRIDAPARGQQQFLEGN